MSISFGRIAIVLGLLAAVGPFAIDMYLPALPTMVADLNASTALGQMTLTAFFVPFGICQLAYGPISDMIGRKPPLYFGLVCFMAASVGCALAPNIDVLIAFRVLQGVGASCMMVIPRAVIRDLHTGVDAARLMALVMLVFSVCPILAPLIGSALIIPFGWRAIFLAVVVASAAGFLLVRTFLPETRLPQDRVRVSAQAVLSGFGGLLRDPLFLGLTFIGGLGMCSFFSFLANSSFVYIEHFGLTPTQFSFAFSVNAIGFIGVSQFAGRLGARFGLNRVVRIAATCYTVCALILFAGVVFGPDNMWLLMALLFPTFAFTGLIVPTTMVLALEHHGPIAGMASALGGTLQMVAGGLMITIVSQFADGTAVPMVTAIALCATGVSILTYLTLGRSEIAPAGTE